MTGAALLDLLTPTLTVRLGKDIIVGGYVRFNAHEVVQVRVCERGNDYAGICVSSGGVTCEAVPRDLAGAELVREGEA